MKRCPKCGSEVFLVSAHVVQDWKVDSNGQFLECVDDCLEVTHFPDDDDIWDCANCSYYGPGKTFNI